MLHFKIKKDYYIENEEIYPKQQIAFRPGVTVLVGCNGCGKTTLIKQIKYKCIDREIPVIQYDNLKEGGAKALDRAAFNGEFDFVSTAIQSSEGENISLNIGKFATKIGKFVKENQGAKEIVILMDAIDSGFSVDNVLELKHFLFDLIIKDCKKDDITLYIIVSANEYELARGEQCYDVSTCSYVDIGSYEEYRDLVINSRKKKNERYRWGEFRLK